MNDFLSKFYALGFTHEEVESLLQRVSEGAYLTAEEYNKLMIAISLIEALSNFDGSYDSLTNKPDIVNIVEQSNKFATTETLHSRISFSQKYIESYVKKALGDFKLDLDQNKSDINHEHDDRYSLLNHDHTGLYVTNNDLNKYVTKDYLESVIAGLGPSGGGGGSIYPTYVQPKITLKANVTSVAHKEETSILITPTYNQNDAGELIKFSIIKDSEVIFESTEIKEFSELIILKHGEMATYTFKVEYGDGIIKDTMAGDPYPETSIKAGVVTAGISIKCQADSFIGIIEDKEFEESDIDNFISIRNASKSYIYIFNINNQKSVYMYPKSFGELSAIKDANNFEYINSYTKTIIVYDEVEYYVYVLTDAVTVEGGFKQIFS